MATTEVTARLNKHRAEVVKKRKEFEEQQTKAKAALDVKKNKLNDAMPTMEQQKVKIEASSLQGRILAEEYHFVSNCQLETGRYV